MNNGNNAIINFLNPKLNPQVSCNSSTADCYEATNLISDNYLVKSRGFLAYSTIKPPVELEFKFLCNVSIHYIKLITVVGSQKCTGIEILGKDKDTSPYMTLAKVVYDKPGIVFYDRKKYSSNSPIFEKNLHMCSFNRNTFKMFLNAASLKIIIFRTEKSVPCLGSAGVWGTPAKSCSRITAQTVYKIMNNSSSTVINNLQSDQSLSQNHNQQDNVENFQVPDDFKDDLTYEIMTIPMTLPSGKTIDQSTLDKHLEVEKSFGRKPCDPFTGVKFTKTMKPILNVALKSRIDMFLIQNSHRKETFNLGRTIGRLHNNEPTTSVSSVLNINKRKCETEKLCVGEEGTSSVTKKAHLVSQCSKCKAEDNLYVISCCEHIFCRQCVLKCCEKLECSLCLKTFERSDVIKCNS